MKKVAIYARVSTLEQAGITSTCGGDPITKKNNLFYCSFFIYLNSSNFLAVFNVMFSMAFVPFLYLSIT